MNVSSYLKRIVERKSESQPPGIFSICSANPFVLNASMVLARDYNFPLLIESTCNQVNQFGGYMRLTPGQFVDYVFTSAEETGLSSDSIFLGGDHLGPLVWKNEIAEAAMEKSRELVREYIRAGYRKIHLDASVPCKEDEVPLTKETVAGREAQLCKVALDEITALGGEIAELVFVVGTEVPAAGGSSQIMDSIEVSSAQETEENIHHTRKAFLENHLHAAWDQTLAFVVQPGVEFSDTSIHRYDRKKAQALSSLIAITGNLVFEAHSTDYQTRSALKEMVEDHFAILKVGPALTFAMRESLFALEEIETVVVSEEIGPLSNLKKVLDQVMLSNPESWKEYYSSEPHIGAFQRKYSFLDRCRYYWTHPEVEKSMQLLIQNLSTVDIPTALTSQYLPDQFIKVREGLIKNQPMDLIRGKISDVIEDYVYACNLQSG